MFIATPTPEAAPSSVGAAWVGCVALWQGLGESGGAPGHKHAAPYGAERIGRRSQVKSEARRSKAERRPKPESRSASGFGIRISALGLLSALGFRPSDFKAKVCQRVL